MAVYRQVQITFWQDPFILELRPEEKYFYLYLLTNSKTTQCGIYEISEMIIQLETGLDKDKVEDLLNRFVEYEKIQYDKNTKEIYLLNWLKFNPIDNTNIEKCVLKELKNVKSEEFISSFLAKCLKLEFKIPRLQGAFEGLIYPFETLNKTEIPPCKKKEKEKEKEEEKEKEQQKEKDSNGCNNYNFNLPRFLEKCNFILSPMLIEKLETDMKIYSEAEVYKAIEIADENGKRSYAYVKGILEHRQAGTNGKEENHGANIKCIEDPDREGIGFKL